MSTWEIMFFACLTVIVISAVIASRFCDIAKMKGHNGTPYFWYCFLFSIVGWAMVIALPDLHARPAAQPANSGNSGNSGKTTEVVSDELPDL